MNFPSLSPFHTVTWKNTSWILSHSSGINPFTIRTSTKPRLNCSLVIASKPMLSSCSISLSRSMFGCTMIEIGFKKCPHSANVFAVIHVDSCRRVRIQHGVVQRPGNFCLLIEKFNCLSNSRSIYHLKLAEHTRPEKSETAFILASAITPAPDVFG